MDGCECVDSVASVSCISLTAKMFCESQLFAKFNPHRICQLMNAEIPSVSYIFQSGQFLWRLTLAKKTGWQCSLLRGPSSSASGLFWFTNLVSLDLFRSKVDGFVPPTHHVNLRIVGQAECGGRTVEYAGFVGSDLLTQRDQICTT